MEETLKKIRDKRNLSSQSLCSIDELSTEDISLIFELTQKFKENGNKKLDLLKNKTIFNLFFENSTRTRVSFELAGKALSANVINIFGTNTSVKKGESMLDTAKTLEALQADLLVVRTNKSGMPDFLSKNLEIPIINAGDGCHEHPSQALLDAFTIMEEFGTLENKTILIVGDILHSRVFGSLSRIILKLGGILRVCAPNTFIPRNLKKALECEIYNNIKEALVGTDVVYSIRVQSERGAGGFMPSEKEYAREFGINSERFEKANENAILMDAGPVIRGVQISSDLISHKRCRILNQVENGLAVRKALLWLLA